MKPIIIVKISFMMIITMLVLLFVVGFTSYHKVTDLNSGKTYYTTEVKYKGSGAVDIKDKKTWRPGDIELVK